MLPYDRNHGRGPRYGNVPAMFTSTPPRSLLLPPSGRSPSPGVLQHSRVAPVPSSESLGRPCAEYAKPSNDYRRRSLDSIGSRTVSDGPYSCVPGHVKATRDPRFSRDSISSDTYTLESGHTIGKSPNFDVEVFDHLLWSNEPEADDKLHDGSRQAMSRDRSFTFLSSRGWLNVGALFILVALLVGLFAGFPIFSYYARHPWLTEGAWNIGGINASGQIPDIPNLANLIDLATPSSARTRTGFDGNQYNLVFSDEFETDGRTFWPGDDPFWEAVDLHYHATNDYEWYDPDAITTKNGKLEITMTEQPIHGLQFRSGMLQSWNKFCFTGGYIEVSLSFPGTSKVAGYWPGAWTLGQLSRAGYGATTDGVWPYSYNACDVGTMKNQTDLNGNPPLARTSGLTDYGGALSYQPGQKLSACTCPGEDHPGPSVHVGRGAPEIDIIEAQISYRNGTLLGSVSQSAQIAPYDAGYGWDQTAPAAVIHDARKTWFNSYTGGVYQESVSGVTETDQVSYGGRSYDTYGFEYWPDTVDGYIRWAVGGKESWTLNAAAISANASTQVSQRLISQEPMSIVLNLGISEAFQDVNWGRLRFPATFYIDYVRVYQRAGSENIGCDPKDMPTAQYIRDHLNAYTNPNLTTWELAGYQYPTNRLQNGGTCN